MPDFAGSFILIACYFGYLCVAERFCGAYLEISRVNEKLFVIFGFCAGMLIDAMGKGYSIPNIVLTLLEHTFMIGFVFVLFRGKTEKKLLAASILIAVRTITENFCTSLFSCLALFWLHVAKNIAVPFLGKGGTNLMICISLAITMLVLYWSSQYLSSIFCCKMGKWYIVLAIPLLAATAVIDVANWGASNGILLRSGGDLGVYYDQMFSHVEFCVLTVLSALGAGFFVFGMNKIYLEQEKSNQYRFQIAAYEMLEEQYSQSERLRHDLKNHIIALRGLLENREWENMENYLKNMEACAGLGIGEEMTGNRVVDILLYQKRAMAERKHIIWECDVQIPKTGCIDAFDLCILFGNLVDNALEACGRLQQKESYCNWRQFIDIQARTVKKCFLLEIKNSADMEEGLVKKEKQNGHGIGLWNVSDVVHKYSGTMNTEVLDGVFVISILMPLFHSAHDNGQAI